MAINLSFLISIVCLDINIEISHAQTDCTYLQGELDIGNDQYLVAYVPYVCMSYGRTHYTKKDQYHTHIDDSFMFTCQNNGQLRYQRYDDADCEDKDPSITSNLNTGDDIDIDGDTLTITGFNCDNTSRNATCEYLKSRVTESCSTDNPDGPLYDEIVIIDQCLPTSNGKYEKISCSWYEAARALYDDEDCTENMEIQTDLHNDYYDGDCSSEMCRDLGSCRRNFTMCSNGGANPFRTCDDWHLNVAQEFFCQSPGETYCFYSAFLLISLILCVVL